MGWLALASRVERAGFGIMLAGGLWAGVGMAWPPADSTDMAGPKSVIGAGYAVFLAGLVQRRVRVRRELRRMCAEARSEAGVRELNERAPALLARAGGAVPPEVAAYLVWRHDVVPGPLRDRLTWHPTAELRERARQSSLFKHRAAAEPGTSPDRDGPG